MLQLLRNFYDWFRDVYGIFFVASLVAIPFLSYRCQQDDFNIVDKIIMYATVFIGAFGLLQDDIHGRPQQGRGPLRGRVN